MFGIARISLSLLTALILTPPTRAANPEHAATLTLHVDQAHGTISPEIYGRFAEHLDHCIYCGVWVGPDSPIPNARGIRNDVVAALKCVHVPVIRWPGGCFADEYHWKDGIGPPRQAPPHDQHPLGRRRRRQCLRHPRIP